MLTEPDQPTTVIDEDTMEALWQGLIDDGFTGYHCGPRDRPPAALVAYYEWPDAIDMITIADAGPAAAARLPKPAGGRVDVLNPAAAVWSYEGAPELALAALLGLVHPDHPDAPRTEFDAPAALRVPRARQRPMTIRLPHAGKAGGRARRLGAALGAIPEQQVRQALQVVEPRHVRLDRSRDGVTPG